MANPFEKPDEELMGLVGGGDERAFEELLRRYEKRVLNFANHLLGNPASAEDILQQTFLNLFESAKTYKPSGKFSTFLFCIARNLCLNERARKKPSGALVTEPATFSDDPASVAETGEESAQIRRALETLPPVDREIVWLRAYEKMSYRDISELLGIRENTARSRLRYALKLLSRRLGELD